MTVQEADLLIKLIRAVVQQEHESFYDGTSSRKSGEKVISLLAQLTGRSTENWESSDKS